MSLFSDKDGSAVIGTAALSGGVATLSVSSFALGNHPITAVYGGDANDYGSTSAVLNQSVTLIPTTTSLSPSVNPALPGQAVTFTASVSTGGHGTATGTVTFEDGTTVIGTGALANGTATFTTTSLTLGGHPITAAYGGDADDAGSTSAALIQTVQVASTTTRLTTDVNPSAPGQPVTLTASVGNGGSAAPTGTVTFKDGSAVLGFGTLANGAATLTVASLSMGGHSLTAVYNGDANDYGSTSAAVTQTVQPAATAVIVTSNLDPSHPWDAVSFSATVSASYGTPTGTVAFYDGPSVIYSGPLSGGAAGFSTDGLALGDHAIAAVYGGDANDYGSTSPVWTQLVRLVGATTALVTSVNPAQPGQGVTLTATVSTGGQGTATGGVAFYDGSSVIGTATLANGQATFATSALALGNHSLAAVYGGDARDYGSTSPVLPQRVQLVTTTTLTSGANPATATDAVTFTATVGNGGVETPTGVVTFKDGGTVLGTGTLSNNGQATLTISSLAVGGHSITAVYGGDANDQASTSAPLNQSVQPIPTTTTVSPNVNPALPGQAVTLTATVSAGRYPTPAGTVTFLDGNASLGTAALVNGVATFTTSALPLGPHTITAAYNGSATDAGSTSAVVNQNVRRSTTTTLSSTANPSTVGQGVTFFATVSAGGQASPTGTVTFEDGTTALGTAAVSSNGMAYLGASALIVGNHPITAVYSGDAYDQASTSVTLTQIVQPFSTTTSLFSSPNPSTVGQAVTLTAVVNNNGHATPTGTVTFDDGSTVIGTAALSNGTASLTVSTLPAGVRSLTAVYGGDSVDAVSASGVVSQDVRLTPTPFALFGTGVNDGGGLLPTGTADPHWNIIAAPSPDAAGPAVVVGPTPPPAGSWAAGTASSQWVAPHADESGAEPAGSYTYETTFDLTGFDPATASITGMVAADDTLTQIRLNGASVTVPYGMGTPSDDAALHALSISSGFVAGLNTLDFVVTNQSGSAASGFQAQLSGAAIAVPMLYGPGDQAGAVGDAVALPITAADAANNPLTFSATGLPPGLSIDPSGGTITGVVSVGADAGGPYTVTVTASDGKQSAGQTFAWVIGHFGILSPGDQANAVGDRVSLPTNGADPDGDAPSFSASNLPPGLSIETDNGLITGTVAEAADGATYAVTLTATDGAHTARRTFNWTVTHVFVVNPGDQQNRDGDQVQRAVTARDGYGAAPSYSAVGLPPGLSITPSGQIAGTVSNTADAGGPYTVTVTATAGAYSAHQTFTWIVSDPVTVANVGAQTFGDGNVSLQISADDADPGTLSYGASGLPSWLSINQATGLITGKVVGAVGAGEQFASSVLVGDGLYSALESLVWVVTAAGVVTVQPAVNRHNGSLPPDVESVNITPGDERHGLANGNLDIEVAFPSDYNSKKKNGSETHLTRGIYIDVTGKDVSNVSFFQYVQGRVYVDYTNGTSGTVTGKWYANGNSANAKKDQNGKDIPLETDNWYLDSSSTDTTQAGYVESGFPGVVGGMTDAWMYDRPGADGVAQRMWDDTVDFVGKGLRTMPTVAGFTFWMDYSTYVVVNGKAIYRFDWYTTAGVSKKSHPGAFDTEHKELPEQRVGGGYFWSRSVFESLQSFREAKALSKGEMN